MNTQQGLDYEIISSPDEYQVWTPDIGGACIGSGRTREEAINSAHLNLIATAVELLKEPGLAGRRGG